MSSDKSSTFLKNFQFRKFQAYGFLKNLRFFEAFLLLYFLSIDLSYTQIGSLYAIREISRYIFEIPSGLMADAWGRRRTLASSFVFYIFSFLLFYTGSSYVFMIIAMFCFAIGDAFRSGTHKSMIFEYLRLKGWEDQKVNYYGHTRAASQAGSAVSSVLGALVVFFTKEYRLIFLFAIIPYIIDFINIITYPSELEGKGRNIRRTEIFETFRETFRDFIISFRNPMMLGRIFILSSFSGYYRSVRDYLQALIKNGIVLIPFFQNLEKEQRISILIGVVYFFIYLMNSIASGNSAKFLKKMKNSRRALYLTLLFGFIAGLGSGIFYMSDYKLVAIIPFLLIFIIENLRKPIGVSYISESMDKNILASSLSAESQLSSIMAGIYAFLVGYLADILTVGKSLSIVSGSLVIAMLIILLVSKIKNTKS
ncbi:MAG: MFS transporter [Bacteroidota bacterium]